MNISRKPLVAVVVPLLIVTMVVNLTACGTILYPERHNQRPGHLDPGVVVLDAVGLLFFVIPGVIAFAVDFSNNSIYLPHGRSSSNDDGHRYAKVPLTGKPDMAAIENAVRAQTGKTIHLQQTGVQVVRLNSADDLDAEFALYETDSRVALAR